MLGALCEMGHTRTRSVTLNIRITPLPFEIEQILKCILTTNNDVNVFDQTYTACSVYAEKQMNARRSRTHVAELRFTSHVCDAGPRRQHGAATANDRVIGICNVVGGGRAGYHRLGVMSAAVWRQHRPARQHWATRKAVVSPKRQLCPPRGSCTCWHTAGGLRHITASGCAATALAAAHMVA